MSINDLHVGKSPVDVARALTWSITGLDDGLFLILLLGER